MPLSTHSLGMSPSSQHFPSLAPAFEFARPHSLVGSVGAGSPTEKSRLLWKAVWSIKARFPTLLIYFI